MSGKKRFRVKGLDGTPFMVSVDQKLGKGSYGEVYRAYSNDQPNLQLVVKIISLENEHNLASVESELAIVRELPHQENLVNCLRVHVESSHNLYIIMEYCNGGSLENYLKNMVLMPQHQIWEILKQIAKGYRVLHDANLIHRDIKPDNILIHNGTFKLADFGLSRRIVDTSLEQNISMKGSPLYMAPELVERSQGCSKVDVFSMGCVLYQLAYDGNSPFYTSNLMFRSRQDYFQHVKTAELILKQKNKKGQPRSLQLRQLISLMLEKDSSKRISWEQIFAHNKIKLNQIHVNKQERPSNNEQKELDKLKISLFQMGKSIAKLNKLPQIENVREESEGLTLELVEFEQIMGHQQLRELEHLMYRCKITTLTIIHANHKIVHFLVGKNLHPHLKQQLNNLINEGFLFLLKVNTLAAARLDNLDSDLISKLRIILNADRARILEEFKKNSKKQLQEEDSKTYDLRRYQNELYGFLTEYCDFPPQLQNRVRSVMALLVDIYDSALKLIEMALNNNVGQYQIETSMDAICWGKVQAHYLHEYLLAKEHAKESDIRGSLKQLGLLFE